MIPRTATMLAQMAAVIPSLAAGQAPPQKDVGQIVFGEQRAERLTASSPTFEDGTAYRIFVFEGARGDSVSISLTSDDFDAFLILATDVNVREIDSDDNSGRCWDAFVATVLPDNGRYAIYVGAAAPGELGQFSLSIERGLQAAPADDGCRGFVGADGSLGVGDSVAGVLERVDRYLPDSTYYELWLLSGTEGKTVTIDLASEDFDAVLMLIQGLGRIIAVDDDGGGDCNARIVYPNPDGLPLRVVARARGSWQLGSYTLRLTEGQASAAAASPCPGRPAGRPPQRD